MIPFATLSSLKSCLLALSGGSIALAHVHAGLALYVATRMVVTRRAALTGVAVVVMATVANELAALMTAHGWVAEQRLGPALATIGWPTALCALSHVRRWRWAEARMRGGRPVARPAVVMPESPMAAARPAPSLRLVTSMPDQPARTTPGAAPRLRVFPGSGGRRSAR